MQEEISLEGGLRRDVAIDWKRVRADYEEKDLSFRELAAVYGHKEGLIKKRAKKEGWKKRAGKRKKKRGAHPGNLIEEHRNLWGSVKRKLTDGLEKSDEKELKIAKLAGDVLMDIVKGEREAWGIIDNDFSACEEDILSITRQMERATVPSGAEKALERE
ncbi:MAG TPA: hypothetical protein VI914_06925 [Thermodesulfobacteriota bacterium]|nr:hypothetical protein [Thermodesulfobacteriota bacterium]